MGVDNTGGLYGATVFEELTIMKSAWGPKLYNAAAYNNSQVETCLIDFEELLIEDVDALEWENDLAMDLDDELLVV
ncbi:hypothetical protein BYT27DRAFT_7248406 [Phlegmacium glaucopus]|nr:hypothetical protein BYT27DRAFT_7248406 [Phlegmacium glaucopus]